MIENKLSAILGARRLKVQDVAKGTGLAYKTVLKLYHDRNDTFDRDVLARVCGFLGIGVGDLLVYVPIPETSGGASGAGDRAGVGGG